MAEKGGAQNEAGKLFVDIGIGGLGKALKSLNSISATFLLGKEAATKFAQTISKPFEEAGKGAIEIGKMTNALATSSIEFQKLAQYLKNMGVSDALLGDVEKLNDLFTRISEHRANIPSALGVAMSELNLDPNDYKGTFKDTMKYIDDVLAATANLPKNRRNMLLKDLQLQTDWGYLWDQGGRAGDYLTISDEQIEKLQTMQEAMNKAKETLEVLKNQFLSEVAPKIASIADGVTSLVKKFVGDGGVAKTVNAATEAYNAVKPKNAAEATANALIPLVPAYKSVRSAIQGYKNTHNGNPMGGAAPIFTSDIEENASLPPNLSSLSQNITNNITHDITINGDNASQIANKIAGLSEQDIQYSQYQASNMAGI